MDDKQIVFELDSRRRISLGSLAQHDRYLANVEEDGTIVLTPAVVMPVAQARLLAAAETAGGVEQFLDQPGTGSRRSRPVQQETER